MSFLPDRIVVLGILCCLFLLINDVQCRRQPYKIPTTPKNPKVTLSKEDIRLVDGTKRCGGHLQVKSSDSWQYVCFSKFTTQNTFVTCRDFDCGFPAATHGNQMKLGEDDSWSGTFNCSGQEQHLADCPVAPLESDYGCTLTVLDCSDQPEYPEVNVYSLKGSDGSAYGTVYAGHSYVIMCRIDAPIKVRSFVLRVWEKPEWSEPAVDNAAYFFLPYRNNGFSFTCQYNFEIQPETFSNSRDGGVYFRDPSNYARLAGGASQCLGRLELEHEGEWRAVSQQLWGLNEAAVVCRQLHCGSVISTDTQSQSRELQPVWRFYSDCDGSERALLGCGSVRPGKSASTVSVLCSDILHPANISAEAEKNSSRVDSTVIYSPYSFYINCSVLPQFPGGHFSLVFAGVKHSLTLNQTAVNHSAVFTFDLAEKAHSGNYSCIYHNTVSGHNFSSQSPQLVIVVEDAEDVLLDDGGARHFNRTVCSGTLLVKDRFKTMMVTAETLHWDMRHASIVCRQLGCGSALSTSETQVPNVTSMWRFFSDCDGSEAALLQCGRVKKWFSSKAIVVVCEG